MTTMYFCDADPKNILQQVLVLILLVTVTVCLNSGRTSQSSYYPVRNHSLQGNIIETSHSPFRICARACLMHASCVSFNYYERSQLCELNSASRVQYPELLLEQTGSVYYDTETGIYKSCIQLLAAGYTVSGVYTIYPAGLKNHMDVYCDQNGDGGGWIVFQRRQDGSVDFNRAWEDYKNGFGNFEKEFWLGNEKLRLLTDTTTEWQLHTTLTDFNGNTVVGGYGRFFLEGQKYVLRVGSRYGNISDGLTYHNGKPFSTKDQDNDSHESNCAATYEGGWWFNGCLWSNLNGKYYPKSVYPPRAHGVQWGGIGLWQAALTSLKQTHMKIREIKTNIVQDSCL